MLFFSLIYFILLRLFNLYRSSRTIYRYILRLYLYIPFVIVYLQVQQMQTNLDALATSITILVSTFFAIESYSMGQESLLCLAVLTGALLVCYCSTRIFIYLLALGGAINRSINAWVLFIVG